jgi:hypothetical protein
LPGKRHVVRRPRERVKKRLFEVVLRYKREAERIGERVASVVLPEPGIPVTRMTRRDRGRVIDSVPVPVGM